MNHIDLHTHTTASDGTFSPTELIHLAEEKGIHHLAVTDHDSIEGFEEAYTAAKNTSVTPILGIELSSKWENRDIHVLGFGFDPADSKFQSRLQELRDLRIRRNEAVIRKMNEDGIPITWEDLTKDNHETVITRAHFARYLTEHHYTKDNKDAFARFMGTGCPYYIPRKQIRPDEAVSYIKEAGGYAFLAHPGIYHLSAESFEALFTELMESGLYGIEVCHSAHTASDEAYYADLAKKHQLHISGGSDFHGSNKPTVKLGEGYGSRFLEDSFVKQLIEGNIN